jgi:glycosyltransferase involved in cell wall biosynthesis
MLNNRKRIGFLFTSIGRESMGVLNYFISIIKAVETLPDAQKPTFVILYDAHIKKWVEAIDYPYLDLHLVQKQSSVKLLFKSLLTGKNHFVGNMIDDYDLDGVYPVNDYFGKIEAKRDCKVVAWFPDFQHKFYPQYFTKTNLVMRELRFRQLVKKGKHLVLSSKNAASHFQQFYQPPAGLQVDVLPFVSMLLHYKIPDFDLIKEKYKVSSSYFIIANQFYKHKNHILAFEAAKILRDKGIVVHIVCTGKMEDYRNPDYIDHVKEYLSQQNLNGQVQMLGIIPREDQLCLMKNAQAIIQPSKFEGWSTVIEDAKTLQKPILASNFAVHKEQLGDKGLFFDEDNSLQLADLLEGFIEGKVTIPPVFDNYAERQSLFAERFISIFQ